MEPVCQKIFSDDPSTPSEERSQVENVALALFSKYPINGTVTKLQSTLEIKQNWLYSEWGQECQFSKDIRPSFPVRDELNPKNLAPNVKLIESVFHEVRGKYLLWQAPREEARWKKVEVEALELDWVKNNVEVLYPCKERFQISEIRGLVLWNDLSNGPKRYKLYEGNHRVSAWLASQTPQNLPATLYIGKPKN